MTYGLWENCVRRITGLHAGGFGDVGTSVTECDLTGCGIHGIDDGERIDVVAFGTQRVAATLESLLHGDADAGHARACLTAQADQTVQRLAVRQKIIDEQHVLAGVQILFRHNDGELLLLGEGIDGGDVLVAVKVDGLRLLGEHHRHIAEMLGGDAGDADAGSLDGQDLVDLLACEMLGPCRSHTVEQAHIALVVKKRVHLEHVAFLDCSLALNALFEFLH